MAFLRSSSILHLYLESVESAHAPGPGELSLHPQKQFKKVNKMCKSISKSNKLCVCTHLSAYARTGLSSSFSHSPSFSALLPISYKALFLSPFLSPEPLQREVQSMAFLEVVSKLRSHENKTVAQQASLTEQRLAVES